MKKKIQLNDLEFDADLIKIIGEPIRVRPLGFGISIVEYRQQCGCTLRNARSLLDKSVIEGRMKKEMMMTHNGYRRMIYSKKEKE